MDGTTDCCSHALHSTTQHARSAHSWRYRKTQVIIYVYTVQCSWASVPHSGEKKETLKHTHTWHILNNMIRSSIRIKSSKWNDAIAVNNNNNGSSEKSAATECSPEMILLFMCSVLRTLNSFFISSAVGVCNMQGAVLKWFRFSIGKHYTFYLLTRTQQFVQQTDIVRGTKEEPKSYFLCADQIFSQENQLETSTHFIHYYVCVFRNMRDSCLKLLPHMYIYVWRQMGSKLKLNNNVLCNRGK